MTILNNKAGYDSDAVSMSFVHQRLWLARCGATAEANDCVTRRRPAPLFGRFRFGFLGGLDAG